MFRTLFVEVGKLQTEYPSAGLGVVSWQFLVPLRNGTSAQSLPDTALANKCRLLSVPGGHGARFGRVGSARPERVAWTPHDLPRDTVDPDVRTHCRRIVCPVSG